MEGQLRRYLRSVRGANDVKRVVNQVRTLHAPNSPALPSIIALDSQLEDSLEMGEMEDSRGMANSRGMADRENSWEPEDSQDS